MTPQSLGVVGGLLSGFLKIFLRGSSLALDVESFDIGGTIERHLKYGVDRSVRLETRMTNDQRRQQWLPGAQPVKHQLRVDFRVFVHFLAREKCFICENIACFHEKASFPMRENCQKRESRPFPIKLPKPRRYSMVWCALIDNF